jgi:hypothetical protein
MRPASRFRESETNQSRILDDSRLRTRVLQTAVRRDGWERDAQSIFDCKATDCLIGLLGTLDQRHRSDILVSSLDDIEDDSNDQHPSQHRRRPIHRLCCDRCREWPSQEENQRRQKGKRKDVDCQSKLAQRPHSFRQLWSAQSTADHACDGEVVRQQSRDGAEGCDGI